MKLACLMITVALLPAAALGAPSWADRDTFTLRAEKQSGLVAPVVASHFQALSQEIQGVNLATVTSVRIDGPRRATPELEISLNVGRDFGRFDVVGNILAGVPLTGAFGVDSAGAMSAGVTMLGSLRLSLDARMYCVHEEAQQGRDYDFVAGPAVGWRFQVLTLSALVGIGGPRGSDATGLVTLAAASFDFWSAP